MLSRIGNQAFVTNSRVKHRVPAQPFKGIRSFATGTKKGLGLIEEIGATTRKFEDPYFKHRTIVKLSKQLQPHVAQDIWIAPSASITGHVTINEGSSIWYGCVIRADVNAIKIGAYTNVQDETVIHEASGPLDTDHDGSTIIGNFVTIGHKCTLKACTVEDECLIGMGSILEEGSYMEKQSMLGGGTVLTKGTRVPSGELWIGNPGKFYRKLTDEEIEYMQKSAQKYYLVANKHKDEYYLPSTLWRTADKLGLINWK